MSTLKVNNVQSYGPLAGTALTLQAPLSLEGTTLDGGTAFTNISNGSSSVAFGGYNTCSSDFSFAVGSTNHIDRFTPNSFAFGTGNKILGAAIISLAHGVDNTLTGAVTSLNTMAAIAGNSCLSEYNETIVTGRHVTASAAQQVSIGLSNAPDIAARFVVGAGNILGTTRRNVLAVHNDKMVLSGSLLIVSGSDTIVRIQDLPTSDPESSGQLFTTQSAGTGGNLDGTAFRVLCVSQG